MSIKNIKLKKKLVNKIKKIKRDRKRKGRIPQSFPVIPNAPVSYSEYTFMQTDSKGTPAKWNFCEDIYFVTNTLYDGSEFSQYVTQAFDELSRVVGKKIINSGNIENPSLYDINNRDVPDNTIVVVFTNGQLSPQLDGNYYAWATFYALDPLSDGLDYEIVGAKIIVDINKLIEKGYDILYRLLLHEIGHTMNLGHVDNPSHAMYTYVVDSSVDDYDSGDIKGLSIVSERNC